MTQQQQTLIHDVLSLPSEGQRQVADLVARLKLSEPATSADGGELSTDPFVGMWKDRQGLADSTAWVREVRASEW